MSRRNSGKCSPEDVCEPSHDDIASPRDIERESKTNNKNNTNKPTIKSVEKLNVTVSMVNLDDRAIPGPSKDPLADSPTATHGFTERNLDNSVNFNLNDSLLSPIHDVEFINLDDYNEDDENNKITRKQKLSNKNRGQKRKCRVPTSEEDSLDDATLMYGAVDKASAELDGMSVDGVGRRAIEWIDGIECMRRKSKSLNGKISGGMRVSLERLKHAVSLLAARSGAGGDPVYLTKKNNELNVMLAEEKSKYANLKIQHDLDQEYAEFRGDVTLKKLTSKYLDEDDRSYQKTDRGRPLDVGPRSAIDDLWMSDDEPAMHDNLRNTNISGKNE